MSKDPTPIAFMPCCGALVNVIRWYTTDRFTVAVRHSAHCEHYKEGE